MDDQSKIEQQLREHQKEIDQLKTRYDTDEKWLRQTLTDITTKIESNTETTNEIKRVVTNGLSHKVSEMHTRLSGCEDELEEVLPKEEFENFCKKHEEKHRQEYVDESTERNRRKNDKYKTASIVVSILGMFIALGSMLAMWMTIL